MKALTRSTALPVIALMLMMTSVSFAQNCGLVEADASRENSYTWTILKLRFHLDGSPRHWEDQEADYYINTLSSKAPSHAAREIKAAGSSWTNAAWNSSDADDFKFKFKRELGVWGNVKDGKNVVAFQDFDVVGPYDVPGITYYVATERRRRDRLKEVDTMLNTKYYWATGAVHNKFDVQSVMAHEFGHWLVLFHLFPHPPNPNPDDKPEGCDEFIDTVMYFSIGKNMTRRTLHWIDKWGKWYIYSSGQVSMAPSMTRFPPAEITSLDILETRLLNNYPDPFNPETWIPFELARDSNVSIDIYDTNGGIVRSIAVGSKPRGKYIDQGKAVHWDGRNNNGENVASGVYFYTLYADGFSQTRRMVILK